MHLEQTTCHVCDSSTRRLQELRQKPHETCLDLRQKMLNNACPLRKMCAANAHFVKKTRESDYDNYFTLAEITE